MTILSKSNLSIVDVAKHAKDIPALANLHVTCDGTTVAANGKTVLVVGPVSAQARKAWPVEEQPLPVDVTIPMGTVREVMRGMPKDTQFHGLLEHCDLRAGTDEESVRFVSVDTEGRERGVKGRRYGRGYVRWREIVQRRLDEADDGQRVILNLSRFASLLRAVEKAVDDSSGTSVAYVQFSREGDVAVRAVNPRNGQRVVGVLMAEYKQTAAAWLPEGEWEQGLRRKTPKRRVRRRW